MTGSILVVTDDLAIARIIVESLTIDGHSVNVAHEGMDIQEHCLSGQCDIVLVEAGVSHLDGPALLKAMQASDTSAEMIVLARSEMIESAEMYVKNGAYDMLLVPEEIVQPHRIRSLVRHALEISHLEHQLHQTRKMETLGRMTGGVAHDFNNLLTSIMGHTHLLHQEVDIDSAAHRYVTHIDETCKRAATLIHELLVFERNQTVRLERMEINKVITHLQPTLERLLPDHIEFKMALERSENHVLIDRLQLEQVLTNMVVNARDAMPTGGVLVVRTQSIGLDKYESRMLGLTSGDYIRLNIEDTGVGMDEAVRSKIFEPFFTTKEKGKGTGLGLATVYRIVTQSGGTIRVESAVEAGTTFSIYLPVLKIRVRSEKDTPQHTQPTDGSPQPEQETEPAVEAPDVEIADPHHTILVVDDEDDLRMILRSGLEKSGYTVLEASNGIKGLACLDQNDGDIDMVVTDLVMPVMDGVEFVERVQATYPGVKVMFISGSSNNALLEGRSLGGNIPLLKKPFQLTALLRQVGEILDHSIDQRGSAL